MTLHDAAMMGLGALLTVTASFVLAMGLLYRTKATFGKLLDDGDRMS